jgi:hypothetical protein
MIESAVGRGGCAPRFQYHGPKHRTPWSRACGSPFTCAVGIRPSAARAAPEMATTPRRFALAASEVKLTALRTEGASAFGPLLSLPGCIACERRRGQRRVRAGRGASLRRSALRTDCPAVLGLVARRRTHCAHFVRCVQTTATSQSWRRAARAATSPGLAGRAVRSTAVRKAQTVPRTVCVPAHLLGASEARPDLPARAFADTAERFAANNTVGGLRGKGCPLGAIWVATSSAVPGSARASVPCGLTRRSCLSAANIASFATRPRTEQRSAVGAQRRPPPHERPAGCPCRDALKQRKSSHPRTAAKGREQTSNSIPTFHASRKAPSAGGH